MKAWNVKLRAPFANLAISIEINHIVAFEAKQASHTALRLMKMPGLWKVVEVTEVVRRDRPAA